MKSIAPVILFLAAACTAPSIEETSSQPAPQENAGAGQAGECDSAPSQYAIGEAFTDALAAELKKKAGAKSLRIIPPGTMVTMDYRSDRLNISYDGKKAITSINCG